MATKLRREIEPRWVSEYVSNFYPDDEVRLRCPVGALLPGVAEALGGPKAQKVSRPWRPEVDALVIRKDKLILIEGKIFKVMDGLSKLPVYKSLIPETPELQEHKDKPVDMQLLVVRPLSWVVSAAEKVGVKVVEWAPPWIVSIWEERDKYWAPEAVKRREERKETLKRLGFE
jgi:hypothetical protein